nr:immunoglobulin light chain junction region [Macaca mulatta]
DYYCAIWHTTTNYIF